MVKLKVSSRTLSSMSVVSIASGEKIGRSIVSMLGHEPGTMKLWFNAENANSRVLVVRNGSALGSKSCFNLKKPFCSPSWPMTEATPRMRPMSPSGCSLAP